MMENKFGGGHYLECMYPAMSIVGAKNPFLNVFINAHCQSYSFLLIHDLISFLI